MFAPNPTLKFAPSGRWDAPSARPLAIRWAAKIYYTHNANKKHIQSRALLESARTRTCSVTTYQPPVAAFQATHQAHRTRDGDALRWLFRILGSIQFRQRLHVLIASCSPSKVAAQPYAQHGARPACYVSVLGVLARPVSYTLERFRILTPQLSAPALCPCT